jgi:hypothetical protein
MIRIIIRELLLILQTIIIIIEEEGNEIEKEGLMRVWELKSGEERRGSNWKII